LNIQTDTHTHTFAFIYKIVYVNTLSVEERIGGSTIIAMENGVNIYSLLLHTLCYDIEYAKDLRIKCRHIILLRTEIRESETTGSASISPAIAAPLSVVSAGRMYC
jgi:hypothetical protein